MTAPTYTDLLAQKTALERQAFELQRQIDQALKQQRSGVITQVKALMAEHGLSPADIAGRSAKVPGSSGAPRAAVAPKYRDPATGSTWSGRGLKPRWLSVALADGKALTDFAI